MGDPVFLPIPGVRLGTGPAEIKYADRDDLVVMELAEGTRCAAVFTRNAFCAAPVSVARAHLDTASPQYLLINSGNANAGTGEQGLQSALELCRSLANSTACSADQVLPFSTGVIGEHLPVDRMKAAIPEVLGTLSESGWAGAARAIMTTDTLPKLTSRTLVLQGHTVIVTGMAKGAGMICPDMATMLAFLATDAAVDQRLLQICLERAVQGSFNAITVDGDTSTNDACVLVATGQSEFGLIEDRESDDFNALCHAVTDVCMTLARAIVQDGEGATKLVKVQVDRAQSHAEASQVAYTIAHSPLVKTALFAADPNWGRILAAVGRAGVENLDITQVQIWLDEVCIVRDGCRAEDYTEEAWRRVMERDEFVIRVELRRGDFDASIFTCDLSYDYVRINAEYRT